MSGKSIFFSLCDSIVQPYYENSSVQNICLTNFVHFENLLFFLIPNHTICIFRKILNS